MIDVNTFKNKTAAYYTLGCKLNFAETSTIGRPSRLTAFARHDPAKRPTSA